MSGSEGVAFQHLLSPLKEKMTEVLRHFSCDKEKQAAMKDDKRAKSLRISCYII